MMLYPTIYGKSNVDLKNNYVSTLICYKQMQVAYWMLKPTDI